MYQDRGMIKCVFVQEMAEHHLLKMNIRLETQSSRRAGRVWGIWEGARCAAWAGGEQLPAQRHAKGAGGELIWQKLKRWEGSWCCVSWEQHRSSVLGPEHQTRNGRVWVIVPLCIPGQPGLCISCREEAGGGMQLCVQSAWADLFSLHSSHCFINLLMVLFGLCTILWR